MWISVFALAFVLFPSVLTAQLRERAVSHDCRVAVNKLNSDPRSEAFRWALTYGRLGACGPEGATVIARLLRSHAGEVVAVGLFDALILQASANRHPELFETALSLASNRGKPDVVRIGAIQLALWQYDIAYKLPRSFDPPVRRNSRRACAFTIVGEYAYASQVPLSPDSRHRLFELSQRLAVDASSSNAVRSAANCVAYILDVVESPEADTVSLFVPR